MWNKLSTALMAILTPLDKIQSKYNAEVSNLDGSPALTLTPSSSENEYNSTTENRRSYVFTIRIYVERKSGNAEEIATENTLRDLVDQVINKLDENHQLAVDPEPGYTFLLMHAAPSSWGYSGRENNLRVAQISVTIEYDVDTTQI